MAQNKVVRGVHTTVQPFGRGIAVFYRGTKVAQREGDVVTLNSAGWRTVTTKLRMNQFANQFCGGAFNVYQHKGEWYVQNNARNETEPFFDGIQISIAKREGL